LEFTFARNLGGGGGGGRGSGRFDKPAFIEHLVYLALHWMPTRASIHHHEEVNPPG